MVATAPGRSMAAGQADAPSAGGSGAPAGRSRRRHALGRLDSPVAAYYLVLGSTAALTIFGLVMVLSSSSVESLRETGSSFAMFSRQALWAAIGVPLAFVASRIPLRLWKAAAWPLLIVALISLCLIFTGLGLEENGNRNWIHVGGMSGQPSEAAKLALVVWAATILARKQALLHSSMHALVPVVFPGAALLVGLVLLGNDLGTTLILLALLGALLWVAGAPGRLFVIGGSAAAAMVILLGWTKHSRLTRIEDWLYGTCSDGSVLDADYLGSCWQSIHGRWALASGGWWGVGLGGSREKWSWLPEAHNDFIFAIIGEELGLAGSLVVLALFTLLGVGLFLVVLRSPDPFVKIATGGVIAWILGQAVVNIGAVLGLLPVIGVPLPLLSSGGSALVTTLVALGMVIGFARTVPGAQEALAARSGVVTRSLAVVPGVHSLSRRSRRTGVR